MRKGPSATRTRCRESTVADAQAGYMTPPVPVHHLDLSLISLTRRLPVREERPKGDEDQVGRPLHRVRVNPATRPQDALTIRPETNSNDFGGFWNELADFLRRENCFFERFEFLVCSCECAVACLCPRNSISNVVASLTSHDNLKIFTYIHMLEM